MEEEVENTGISTPTENKDTFLIMSESLPPDVDLGVISYQTIDGFDDCIVGVVDNFQGVSRLCYDKVKMIRKLISQGATIQNASETVNSYCFPMMGDETNDTSPCFLDRYADVGIMGYDNYPPIEEIEDLIPDCGDGGG